MRRKPGLGCRSIGSVCLECERPRVWFPTLASESDRQRKTHRHCESFDILFYFLRQGPMQLGLASKITAWQRLALNSIFSCFLPSFGVLRVCHHTWMDWRWFSGFYPSVFTSESIRPQHRFFSKPHTQLFLNKCHDNNDHDCHTITMYQECYNDWHVKKFFYLKNLAPFGESNASQCDGKTPAGVAAGVAVFWRTLSYDVELGVNAEWEGKVLKTLYS